MSRIVRAAGPSPHPAAGMHLSDDDFEKVRSLIAQTVGIQLGDSKRALVIARLTPRLRQLGLPSFAAYYAYLTDAAHADERVQFVDSLCTNETSFFRERWQFDYLENVLVPHWRKQAARGEREKRVRVWSSACSTGEEPYSIAMSLSHHLPSEEGWEIDILATDISTRVLRQAREAVWKVERRSGISEAYLRAFMRKGVGTQAGMMKASPELCRVIQFAQVNLQSEDYPVGPFDMVFCRNVLIYFDAKARAAIIEKLTARLQHDGHLFLGHAESLMDKTSSLRTVVASVYTRAQRSAARLDERDAPRG